MSRFCVAVNISILLFVSTCKQLTQSEPMEFSKNGVFHSKSVDIIFSKWSNSNTNPRDNPIQEYWNSEYCDFTPFYAITSENILKSNKSNSTKILQTKILTIYTNLPCPTINPKVTITNSKQNNLEENFTSFVRTNKQTNVRKN